MVKKRDIVNEIISIKKRTEFNSRRDYETQLRQLEFAFEEYLSYNCEHSDQFLKYIPIVLVSCYEAFFRSVIKELIDFGDRFSENTIHFNQAKNVKFEFEIINAIHKKSVTIGEFVSHILPCNNLEDINSNLSILIGENFLNEIKKFRRETTFESVIENQNRFHANCSEVIGDIKKTFELRHIFCHEFGNNVKVSSEDIFRCFKNSKIFLGHVNEYIWHLLYPDAPQTQNEINSEAQKSFLEKEEELFALIVNIKNSLAKNGFYELDENKMDEAVASWKEYRLTWAKFKASIAEGGSMYQGLFHNNLTEITEEKIQSLKDEYNFFLKRT